MNNPRRIQRHLVKALAAGALLAAAALPMAIASVAGAAGSETVTAITFSTTGASNFGTGASGTVAITGTNFAADGGNVTVTSNAPGLTFSGAAETDSSDATASFASTSATVPGSYSVTVTDDAGTATLANAFTVNAAPTVSSASPASLSDGNPLTSVTINGSGFVTGASVTITDATNGTTLTVGSSTVAVGGASLTVNVTPTNSVTDGPASAGAYNITVTNPDGGNSTLANGFTITAYGITALSPSAVPIPTSGSSTTSVVVTGAGFEFGAAVTLTACTGVTVGTVTVTSATSLTVSLTTASGSSIKRCAITVTNPSVGGNGATSTAAGAFGVGEAGDLAPIITASSLTTGAAINAGDPAAAVTFTGSGFSQYTIGGSTYDSTGATDSQATVSDCSGNSGTSLLCEVTVSADATSGSHTAALFNDGSEGDFANAFSVGGPAITSAAPAALAVGAPVGTVVVLTGTGFTNTTQGSAITAGTLDGVFQFVNATTEDFVVTSSPDSTDVTGNDFVYLYSVDSNGDYVYSPDFYLTIDAAPTISALHYSVAGTTGVGVGATAQTITIAGTGFKTGVTVASFKNGNGVADPSVVATVTSVNLSGTLITATIAIAAGDANPADGYTVTNLDGGNASVLAIQPDALVIDAGPTVTAVSPATGLASATNAFTITGTGFETGAVVTPTSDGTCAPATVASATSITVSCTLGAAQAATSVSLVVSNPDGGSATSAVVLAPATTPPPPVAKPFHVGAVHGHAVVGRTVTVTISGTGFHGAPKITSSAPGTRAVVSHDTGTRLTVRVTTRSTTKAGTKVFTVRQGAHVGRTHYVLVK